MVRALSEGIALFSSDVALLLSGQRFGCYRNRGNRLGVRIRFGGGGYVVLLDAERQSPTEVWR